MPTAIAIHGGAGLVSRHVDPDRLTRAEAGLRRALDAGCAVLDRGGAALDAVCAAVVVLEEDPCFNAGRGGVLASDGTVQMDASVMRGDTGEAGAVGGVRGVRSAIAAARWVMEHTSHVLLVGPDADAAMRAAGLRFEDPAWFVTEERAAQLATAQRLDRTALDHDLDDAGDGKGTVGAVALDAAGHLAAATSTGGLTNKRAGRVGDSAVIGAGTWAEDGVVAISGTGEGEKYLRTALASRLAGEVRGGRPLAEAATWAVGPLLATVDGRGGLIAVDAHGRVALPFNTAGMYRAWRDAEGRTGVAVWDVPEGT